MANPSLGVKAGPTFANYSGAGSTNIGTVSGNAGTLIGYSVGVTFNAAINNLFSINPEALVLQGGSKFSAGSNSFQTRVTYVQVPVLLRFNFGNEGYQFYVNGGPYLGYAATGTYKISSTDNGVTTDQSGDIKFNSDGDGFNRLELGVAVGLGLGAKVGPGMLGVDLRYQQGLTRLQSSTDARGATYNGIFTPSLFYVFRFGGN